jgi:hypothetical protein
MNWIDCKDAPPDIGAVVIVCALEGKERVVTTAYRAGGNVWLTDCDVLEPADVTHWMPFPEPPVLVAG